VPAGEGAVRDWCLNFSRAVQDELADLARNGLSGVIIGARWAGYTAGVHGAKRERLGLLDADHALPQGLSGASWRAGEGPLSQAASLAAMEQALTRELTRLTDAGLRVVVVLPAPEFIYPPPECLQRMAPAQCPVSRDDAEARRSAVKAILERVAAGRDNVRLWDPFDLICDAGACRAAGTDGLARYQDRDHLTATTARSLGDAFAPTFAWVTQPR